MHPDIFSTTSRIVFIPVRHHSPACARMVREIALTLRPAAVLIEGPSDFNARIDELYLPHTLPIAIYSYVRLANDTRRGAFYPFCTHSPEWVALQTARELGATARFIDLPWAELVGKNTPAHRYADGELRESPYIPTLCAKLGVEDFDSLWDTLVEIDASCSAEQILERVHHFCYHIRAGSSRIAEEDLRREAFMAEQIRRAQDEFNGPLLVVTGGFHSYALFARLNDLPAPENQDVKGADSSQFSVLGSDTEPPSDTGIALTPYADARLDNLTGYDAGMPSPGFYRRIWNDRQAGHSETYRQLLAAAVTDLRTRGQIASTADLIAVETSARALAALRGHSEVWRRDLIDAITGALIKEAIEPDTRHPFLDALLTVFRGNHRGALADGVSLPPLVYDIRNQLQIHDLEPKTRPGNIRLDLALPVDLARSRVLHRLKALDIRGFNRRGGADLIGRADVTTIWEEWQIIWTPEFDAACIEAAIYGAALEDAAAARLTERAGDIERSAEQAALLLLDACLMGLSDQTDALFARLIELVRTDNDFFGVGAALNHLLYLFRYDEALGAAGRGDIGALLAETFRRALWLLDMLGKPQGQDRELLRAIRALVQTFEVCETTLALDREILVDALRRAGGSAAQHPLARGAVTGALWTLRAADESQAQDDLRACAAPEQLGDFLTGLFSLARETVQRHPDLVRAIDVLLLEYDDQSFLHALPAMRLAFSFFTPREKHHIARTLLEAYGQTDGSLPALEIDVEIATRALALESRLIGELTRYGIRGGGRATRGNL